MLREGAKLEIDTENALTAIIPTRFIVDEVRPPVGRMSQKTHPKLVGVIVHRRVVGNPELGLVLLRNKATCRLGVRRRRHAVEQHRRDDISRQSLSCVATDNDALSRRKIFLRFRNLVATEARHADSNKQVQR